MSYPARAEGLVNRVNRINTSIRGWQLTSGQTTKVLQPRHHNADNFQYHHIIVNIFPWPKICRNPFHPNTSLLFSYQFPKIYHHFENKKYLMKPNTFEFKSLPDFLQKLYRSPIVSFLLTCFWIENSENRLCLKRHEIKSSRRKYHISKFDLSVWFIQRFTYFYHIYIYIYEDH